MVEPYRQTGPEDSILVVVDVQTGMLQAQPEKVVEKHVNNMLILITTARELGVPILVTEQYPGGIGATLPAVKDLVGGARFLEKIIFSCTGAPGFLEALKDTGRSNVVLIGTETHICVALTALDLLAEGFSVHLPADGVISRFKEDWAGGISFMKGAGTVITRTETLVFQWLQRADTRAFKTISPLIKNRKV